MAGSMRERQSGVWELRVHLRRDDRGRVQQLSRTFRGQKRAAQRELNRLVRAVATGQITDPSLERWPDGTPAWDDPTIGEWGPATTINDAIRGWELNGWDDLSPSTVRRYRSIWRTHILDSIGKKRLVDLGPYKVEQYLRSLKRAGLSEASVHQTRAMLHRACRLARKWSDNRLPNPVADTEMPDWSLDEQRDEVRAPSLAEVRRLLAAARAIDARIGAFVRMVAATGARRGEVAALRWDDIDWRHGAVTIDESAVVVRGGTAIKRPKTKKSVRILAVDPGTLKELRELRRERETIASRCEVELDEHGFVFATDPSATSPPYLDNFSQAFAKVRKAAGVADDVHLHSLRHFQSTELDPVISEAQKQARLGWSTVQMARHYTGVITDEDRRAAAHIGRVLGRTQSQGKRRSMTRLKVVRSEARDEAG